MTPTVAWWMATNHYRTHKGERLDFSTHRYQVDVLKDKAVTSVAMKSTQCGFTEAIWCWACGAIELGLNVFYVFPDERLRNQHVRDRFDPALDASPYLTQMIRRASMRTRKAEATDEVTLKQIGASSLAFVASKSVSSFRSFVADVAVIEELDQCDQDNVDKVDGRFGHSRYRWKRIIGNPTIEGFGIHAEYQASTQARWMIRCQSCGMRQDLDWFKNVVNEIDDGMFSLRVSGAALSEASAQDAIVVCRKCNKPLDRYGPGEWTHTYPDREVTGWHVNKLMSGTVPVAAVAKKHLKGLTKASALQTFFNEDLGLAFSTSGSKMSETLLAKCIRGYPQQSHGSAFGGGLDVGSLLHLWVLDTENRTMCVQTYRDFEEIDNVMHAFPHLTLVVDAYPETRAAQKFAHRFPSRVFLCTRYDKRTDGKDFKVVLPTDYSVDVQRVEADRTVTMDQSHSDLLRQIVTLPRDARGQPDLFDQLTAPVRIFDEKAQRFVWKSSKPDHYRHALNLATIARDIRRRVGGSFAFSL